jgi:hypothetical protein
LNLHYFHLVYKINVAHTNFFPANYLSTLIGLFSVVISDVLVEFVIKFNLKCFAFAHKWRGAYVLGRSGRRRRGKKVEGS